MVWNDKHKENFKEINKKDLKRLFKENFLREFILPKLKDGQPCEHKGCLHHVSHPCEGCGRVCGSIKATREWYDKTGDNDV